MAIGEELAERDRDFPVRGDQGQAQGQMRLEALEVVRPGSPDLQLLRRIRARPGLEGSLPVDAGERLGVLFAVVADDEFQARLSSIPGNTVRMAAAIRGCTELPDSVVLL